MDTEIIYVLFDEETGSGTAMMYMSYRDQNGRLLYEGSTVLVSFEPGCE